MDANIGLIQAFQFAIKTLQDHDSENLEHWFTVTCRPHAHGGMLFAQELELQAALNSPPYNMHKLGLRVYILN